MTSRDSSARLISLHRLLDKLLVEIRAEEQHLLRVQGLRDRIHVAGEVDVEPSRAPAAEIRAWARTEGIAVGVTGRVGLDLRIQYASHLAAMETAA